ncbi:PTS sugar transporter subunit IIB [Vagococcus fessus]|uniref:PTS sugar transporter subunit IIB n=1 Tax=Vagococcus fessus TaxID=120370 RepID=A0A430A7M1_9ENTE|nr:PTS sugar transporter subunit IIB [Vagococcus fessus]RSU03079.1 PTS sugar transporter subunit IIB [Vagococcus fessus]
MKKQIYLFCEFGMSTSIMVNKMQEVADSHNMPLQITAFPAAKATDMVKKEKPVCILLGPQVKFLFEKINGEFEPQGIPVGVIESEIYGMMDGERALKEALKLIKQNKQK